MSAVEYSENDIEYVVKSFKNYLRKVVKHSAIDYFRKVNNKGVKEIAFTDSVDRNVSLSLYDSDFFLSSNEVKGKLEDNISNPKLKLAIHKLSKDEKRILALSIEEYSSTEIAKIMKLSEKTIRNKKSIIRSKIKKMLGDKSYEDRNE